MLKFFADTNLAAALLPHAFDKRDGAHDEAHLVRVWKNVTDIQVSDGGDAEILLAATLLHDCVWVEKTSPLRSQASRMAATQAREVLSNLGWPKERIAQVCHAIEAHSFSAQITPLSLEAKILQDADRLDAIGFMGVARCIYLAGARNAQIYDLHDPTARGRPLDDIAYALDHFQTKLLGLCKNMQTEGGERIAAARAHSLNLFFQGLLEEIGSEKPCALGVE
jgi:uncharacterized protein